MEILPPEIGEWLVAEGLGEVLSLQPVGGGCIHQSRILQTSGGMSFFLKSHPSAPGDLFQKEARGLRALRVRGGPVVPEVILVGQRFLLLEDLRPAPRRKDFWELYGRQLARVHQNASARFGFEEDNYLGSSPQENSWMESGIEFFREKRLEPQFRRARERGTLDPADSRSYESLLKRLPELIPNQPAALLHGDLWSGNLSSDSQGSPALIDPAVYYGWAEMDLAMTDLFGRYPEDFYRSYQEVSPLLAGYRERFALYNLYHLLNHLNIFGTEYLPGVRETLRRFS